VARYVSKAIGTFSIMSNKRLYSPLNRYFWALAHYFRIFGILMRIWASFIAIFPFTDLLGVSHYGYPWWALPFCALFFTIGHYVTRFARMALARQREALPISN
jgi:hypothetical protein